MIEPALAGARDARADRIDRSPTVAEFRLNPFRVLGLPADAGADEAVWRSEERLTLLRAGLPSPEADALPWLPPPGEAEIRQAVQAAEEPLRRLLARLSWFDFEADGGGEVLRRLLASLDPAEIEEYLNRDAVRGRTASGVVASVNRANLLLLLAGAAVSGGGLSAQDAASEDIPEFVWEEWRPAGSAGGQKPAPNRGIVRTVRDPHAALPSPGAARLTGLWNRALATWKRLLADADFHAYLCVCLEALGDDLVGADDAEAVVGMLRTRLLDLLAGEVKAQSLAGRADRVASLLAAASQSWLPDDDMFEDDGESLGTLYHKDWARALRPARHRFKAEAAELDALLGPAPHKMDDLELYLDRATALRRRWQALDPTDLLGLREVLDGSVLKAVNVLAETRELTVTRRAIELLRRAGTIASASSTQLRVEAATTIVEKRDQSRCHFCRRREMDHASSTTLRGKKTTHMTRSGNTTIFHVLIRHEIVFRCAPCAKFHDFLYRAGVWTWVGFAPAVVVLGIVLFGPLFSWAWGATSREFGSKFILALGLLAGYLGGYWLLGYFVRRCVATRLTPKGDLKYYDISGSKQYKSLVDDGYSVTVDFKAGARDRAVAENRRLPTRSE
jgi:hypothetical protein